MKQSDSADFPDVARAVVKALADQLEALALQIQTLNRRLLVWHRQNEDSQRLATIPGVSAISATALAASVTNPDQFRRQIQVQIPVQVG